jgi:hypothetical protein
MFAVAPLVLRSLLASIVGLLVVTGAAHAHGSQHAESRPFTNPAAIELSGLPQACIAPSATHSMVMLPISDRTIIADSGDHEEDELDDACCAVACHAAVANLGSILLARFRLISIDHLPDSAFLHGKAIAPGDRPPRPA